MSRRRALRALRALALLLAVLLAIEGLAQLSYRLTTGGWLLAEQDWPRQMFLGHPNLVAVPAPAVSVTLRGKTIAHNALGFRGPETTRLPAPGVVRIAALGGSTTYCTGVTEGDPWPARLDAALGPEHEVVNLGVPGYTTVENLIQTAFQLPDLGVSVAVYYEGWNDARNLHLAHLEPDYSGFHGRYQFHNLRLDTMRPGSGLATLHFLRRSTDALMPGLFYRGGLDPPAAGPGALTAADDPRALELYRRNLTGIARLCRGHGIRPLFVPQRMNEAKLTADTPYGWLPHVRDRDLPGAVAAYNRVMEEVAAAEGVDWLGEVLEPARFGTGDFIDQGHFTPEGNRKLAALIADRVRANGPGGGAPPEPATER